MDWRNVDTTNCSVGRALDVVGDRWTLLIIRELLNGVRRFTDLQDHLEISAPVLSRRLKQLADAGLIQAAPYREQGARTRAEYRLTETGQDLQPVVVALMEWGDKHLVDDQGPPVVLTDADTHQRVHLALVRTDGTEVPDRALRWQRGPGHRAINEPT